MAEITQFTYLEPIKVTIERGHRGGVGWEISIHGSDIDTIMLQLKDIEAKLIKFELETPPAIRRDAEIKAPWERGIANQEQREMQARVKEKQEEKCY